MPKPLIKDDTLYHPLETGSAVPEEWLEHAQWGQKTAATKIYTALPGEVIWHSGKERKGWFFAAGNEVVFDNGIVPVQYDDLGRVVEARRDVFTPTDEKGRFSGAVIRARNYRLIDKGVEYAMLPMYGGGDGASRDYGIYLPLPNPQPVIKLDEPRYIPDAFGAGDHQWLDQPVLRLRQENGSWRTGAGVNGPEFKATWTLLGSLKDIDKNEAVLRAEFALNAAPQARPLSRIFNFVRSLPVRLVYCHWVSNPEKPALLP